MTASPDLYEGMALMEARKLLPNASHFAFTATPKTWTLKLSRVPRPQADGTVRHRPFHSYTVASPLPSRHNATCNSTRLISRITRLACRCWPR